MIQMSWEGLELTKTPDCLLFVPKVVDVPIKLIESKALLADESTHQAYYEKQYKKYVDRFGPGVVIYFHDFFSGACPWSKS